jgi:hypothetical protein
MSDNQVTLFANESAGKLSAKFQPLVQAGVGQDLGEGIRGGYGIVGIKAGKFRLKYKGDETVLLNPDGTPVGFVDVVIIKANPFLNKQYFEGKYVDGATAAPVCYSLDGVKPSDSSTKKQATACALCPKNQFGSMIGDNGVKQKACRDTKKLAVVPATDILNRTMGGAMLFRVPPSSLKELSIMADQLKGRGFPYNSVVVRISFDLNASHPKPVFKAQRALTDAEAEQVLEMFESDGVARVLADNDVAADHGEGAVATAAVAPVQPAGMPRAAQGPLPTEAETRPVPQAKPTLVGMPGEDPPVQLPTGQIVKPQVVAMPVTAEASPRVLRVKPDAEPAQAAPVNPFAQPAPVQVSNPPEAKSAQTPAAANPFAPPPTVKRVPVTIDVPAQAPVQEDTQLNSEINDIIKGLGLNADPSAG